MCNRDVDSVSFSPVFNRHTLVCLSHPSLGSLAALRQPWAVIVKRRQKRATPLRRGALFMLTCRYSFGVLHSFFCSMIISGVWVTELISSSQSGSVCPTAPIITFQFILLDLNNLISLFGTFGFKARYCKTFQTNQETLKLIKGYFLWSKHRLI